MKENTKTTHGGENTSWSEHVYTWREVHTEGNTNGEGGIHTVECTN